jgi:hypothetical protein
VLFLLIGKKTKKTKKKNPKKQRYLLPRRRTVTHIYRLGAGLRVSMPLPTVPQILLPVFET